jgi:glycosyltransferase involved in cell wall biosynthesis
VKWATRVRTGSGSDRGPFGFRISDLGLRIWDRDWSSWPHESEPGKIAVLPESGTLYAIVADVRLTIVIPAYNEEAYLPETLDAIMGAVGSIEAEVIVVDNLSTDRTRDVAIERGAKVIAESERNIAAVRNAGAGAASGDVIAFVDADTIVRPGVFEKVIDALSDERCVGGSGAVEYPAIESRVVVAWFMLLWPFLGNIFNMRGGALQFCRRSVFEDLNGYDSTIFVGEDIDFHWRLDKLAKSRGGFTAFIDEPKVVTSSRRWNRMGLVRMLVFTHPITVLLGWRIRSLWKDWYDDAIR